jgi:hypothetical protein
LEGFRVAISSYTTLKDVEELGLLEFLQKGRRLGLFYSIYIPFTHCQPKVAMQFFVNLSFSSKSLNCYPNQVNSYSFCQMIRELLWTNIMKYLNHLEQDVVKTLLGKDLIDENEVLFQEAIALEDIVKTIENKMQQEIDTQQRIWDSPSRSMLEHDIYILLQRLQDFESLSCSPNSLENTPPSKVNLNLDTLNNVVCDNKIFDITKTIESYWDVNDIISKPLHDIGQQQDECNQFIPKHLDKSSENAPWPKQRSFKRVTTKSIPMPLAQLYLLNNNEGENTRNLSSNNYKYHRILQSIFCKKKIQNWEKQKSFPSLDEFKDSQINNQMTKDSSNSSLDTTFDPKKVVQTMALELNLIDIYKITEKLCTLLANEHVKFHLFCK